MLTRQEETRHEKFYRESDQADGNLFSMAGPAIAWRGRMAVSGVGGEFYIRFLPPIHTMLSPVM